MHKAKIKSMKSTVTDRNRWGGCAEAKAGSGMDAGWLRDGARDQGSLW